MTHFEDLRKAAYDAEKDLNSYQAKQGLGKKSDSSKLPVPSTNRVLNINPQNYSSRVRRRRDGQQTLCRCRC